MHLPMYEQVSQAKDLAAFRCGLIDFAHDLGFGLFGSVMVFQRDGSRRAAESFGVSNTPEAFHAAAYDPSHAKRDPVRQQLMQTNTPLVYDQEFYVKAGAGDLWDMQAPYGFKTGIAVAVHMPGYRRFFLGVDRDEALPRDAAKLSRMIADLQLLAVHAQEAASRLLVPTGDRLPVPTLLPRQLEVLRLTMDGKSAWVVGNSLGISENTVNYHLKQVFRKLDVSTKHQAVLRAMDLGLL
jgi:DNA-binding CsgD family transcriptional regulator